MAILDGNNGSILPLNGRDTDTNIYQGIRDTLAQARTKALNAINFAMVEAYWEIGRQIEEAVGERAEYGKGLLRGGNEEIRAYEENIGQRMSVRRARRAL
jgi:hypothetical protein